jgi:hypothetical protein
MEKEARMTIRMLTPAVLASVLFASIASAQTNVTPK